MVFQVFVACLEILCDLLRIDGIKEVLCSEFPLGHLGRSQGDIGKQLGWICAENNLYKQCLDTLFPLVHSQFLSEGSLKLFTIPNL